MTDGATEDRRDEEAVGVVAFRACCDVDGTPVPALVLALALADLLELSKLKSSGTAEEGMVDRGAFSSGYPDALVAAAAEDVVGGPCLLPEPVAAAPDPDPRRWP